MCARGAWLLAPGPKLSYGSLKTLACITCWLKDVEGLPTVSARLSRVSRHTPYLSWRSLRRLCHLRTGLHDPVKHALGSSYREKFGVNFASSFHLPGVAA